MIILGIETSCDETAMSVIEVSPRQARGEEITVLSNVISSQVKLHAKYGGVVPSLAAREHVKNIKHVFNLALKQAGIKDFKNEIDLIAVTRGPGLGPALLVGLTFAKTIAWLNKKPVIGVNHMEGHIYSNWLSPVANSKSEFLISKNIFPALNLIVSGGHTELVLMKNHGRYKIVGETMDDAVGEAFDKVARLLGLGYPGGPAIAKQASQWKLETLNSKSETNSKFKIQNSKPLQIKFPRPMEKSKDFNFSYSGLKTSVLYKVRELENSGVKLTSSVINELAHAFQEAAVDVLVQKTMRAAKELKVKSIFLSGGVSANSLLRSDLNKASAGLGVKYFQPKLEYTGDNATMIAVAGYFEYKKNNLALSKKSGTRKTPLSGVKMDANLGF